MHLSTPFIRRPIGTTLLTIALVLVGVLGYQLLPVAPLPQVEFPTIQVEAHLPGASPDVMAPRWPRRSSASSGALPA